jgi:hypothetical protein
MGLILDGLAWPHIWIPYDQRGVIIVLYINILFYKLIEGDNNGWRRCRRVLDCFLFCQVRWAQVSLLSKWTPRYLVIFLIGIYTLFSDSWGHSFLLREKFIWTDFFSLILIFHFLVQLEIWFKWNCISWVAMFGFLFDASMAVSSAYVARIVWFVFGISDVYIL